MNKNRTSSNAIGSLVVIQSTPFCNLDCTYCYLPGRSSTKRINLETIGNIARVVFSTPNLSEKITILWHAGEPLVIGKDFYEAAHNIINNKKPDNTELTYNFQTNGTLIDDQWCEFFKHGNIKVGVSLDGPQFIHDRARVTRSGNGSFKEVMKGIEHLQRHGINFGVLAVLSRASLDYPNEIFEFFNKNNISSVGFNVEVVQGSNRFSSLNNDTEVYSKTLRFFETLMILSQEKNNRLVIRELEETINKIEKGPGIIRTDNEPIYIVSFDVNGNVSTLSPELLTSRHTTYGDFIFGNANTMRTLDDILENRHFLRVFDDVGIGVKMCREQCGYYPVCGGGNPSDKLYENNTFKSTETTACRLQVQVVSEAVLPFLENKYLRS
ncbi:MAG: cyclophane-forming radical SAM/SPASM peptide maturase GrrM/OscB [Candidatus Micrarchaeaceae archaeon]|jgi:uncharacterized protein|nr:GRRM system radical SAM/SPASM domain protein [Candidatus Micrarchaeota archaeon]